MPEHHSVNDPNKNIFDYLKYYSSETRKFEYAVMLKGPWGSGKTFLINKFIEERSSNSELKTLYVSLYGLNTTSQIDDLFFRQLHPILSHKGMKIAASIAKGLIKTAIKVDLNSDGKDDASISSQIPDIDFKEYFSNPHRCLLIFDDLERCEIKIEIVLGYINSLVEHEGLKTIIIANEDAIKSRHKDKEADSYKDIKEKLVGQTIEIRSSIEDAFNVFIEDINDIKTRRFIKANENIVYEIHKQSKRDNLRILKQALWDFERIGQNLTDRHWDNADPIKNILRSILILSIEFRNGSFASDDFELLSVNPFVRKMTANRNSEKSKLDLLEEKYDNTEIFQDILSPETLKNLLDRGWVDPDLILKQVNESSYYANPKEIPDWKLAWHGFMSSDEAFEAVVPRVEESFVNRRYIVNGEILHVFGLRLMFAQIGAIDKSLSDVVTECKLYIDDLLKDGKIGNRIEHFVGFDVSRSYDGLGVQNSSMDEYIEIYRYYMEASKQALETAKPRFISEIMELMGTDTTNLFREMCINNFGNSRFYDLPLLADISPEAFADKILSISPEHQLGVFTMLDGRYKHGQLDRDLLPEKQWIADLEDIMKNKIESAPVMSKYRLGRLIAQNLSPLNKIKSSA